MESESRSIKVVVAGAVGSTLRTFEALCRNGVNVVGVLGLAPAASSGVSGYTPLENAARGKGVPFCQFRNINDGAVIERVRAWGADLLFVVGLSQLVGKELLGVPRLGCVGFHPTRLPEGRGRAPVAWMVLENRSGAATFFLMDEGADSGPILAQEPFPVSDTDYTEDVIDRIRGAIDRALDDWLPRLLAGEWNPQPQDESTASTYGRRTAADGLVKWERSAHEIHSLIRAASHPYPGAYTYIRDKKLFIWRAEVDEKENVIGTIGQIVGGCAGSGWLVQTGSGLLRLTEISSEASTPLDSLRLRQGVRLGLEPENEIFKLKQKVKDLEARLAELEKRHDGDR